MLRSGRGGGRKERCVTSQARPTPASHQTQAPPFMAIMEADHRA